MNYIIRQVFFFTELLLVGNIRRNIHSRINPGLNIITMNPPSTKMLKR